MQLFGKELSIEEVAGFINCMKNDPAFRNCNEDKCLITQAASDLVAALETNTQVKYLLLSANNVNMDIQATPFTTKEDAQKTMKVQAYMCCIDDQNQNKPEISISENTAHVYDKDDLYYWSIQPIDITTQNTKKYYPLEDAIDNCIKTFQLSSKSVHDMTEKELCEVEEQLSAYVYWVKHPDYTTLVPKRKDNGTYIL